MVRMVRNEKILPISMVQSFFCVIFFSLSWNLFIWPGRQVVADAWVTVVYPHLWWSCFTQNPVSDENWLTNSFNCRSKIPFSLWQGVHFLISVSSTAFTWRSNILQLCTKFWSTTANRMVKCALIVSNVKKKTSQECCSCNSLIKGNYECWDYGSQWSEM